MSKTVLIFVWLMQVSTWNDFHKNVQNKMYNKLKRTNLETLLYYYNWNTLNVIIIHFNNRKKSRLLFLIKGRCHQLHGDRLKHQNCSCPLVWRPTFFMPPPVGKNYLVVPLMHICAKIFVHLPFNRECNWTPNLACLEQYCTIKHIVKHLYLPLCAYVLWYLTLNRK